MVLVSSGYRSLHVALGGRQAADETFPGKDAVHVVLQRLGLLGQLDAQMRQTPQDGGKTAIHQAVFLAHEERHFGKYRRHAGQALAQLLARLGDGGGGAGRIGQYVDQNAPVALDTVHQQTAVGAGHRVHRQQRRVREAFVQVFHHDVGLVEHQVTVKQGGDRIVGVYLGKLLRMIIRLDINDIDCHTFFSQDNAHSVTVLVGRIRKKGHRRTLVGGNTHIYQPSSAADSGANRYPCGLIESAHYTPETRTRPKGRVLLINGYRCRSLHIPPVLALEQVGEHEQERQVDQHVDTDAVTGFLDRIRRVAEEGDQVAHGGVVLFRSLGTGTLHHVEHIILLF